MNKHIPTVDMTEGTQGPLPLNSLIKSPRNARKKPHSAATIEGLAASIAAKGILQNLVVEPETTDEGEPTGRYFVTIGEGRRQAQLLRLERGDISDGEPMPCVINLTADPQEISLDENVTREAMHPADQFEAFRALAEDRNMSAEDIAARFGVTANIVRQRLKLGAASPRLMQAYRDEALSLEQLMAFAITDDHTRQEEVFAHLSGWQKDPYHIRRMLTETHVPATDRRARFIGHATYEAAGGHIIRDLFTDDDGGYFEDAGLLDRLTQEKLTAMATGIQGAEGWKWSQVCIDFPHGHGCSRVYPQSAELSDEDLAALAAAQEEYNDLSAEYEGIDELPEAIDQRMGALEAEIQRLEAMHSAYDPADIARGGIMVCLTYGGTARIERGLIRIEDLKAGPNDETQGEGDSEGDDGSAADSAPGGVTGDVSPPPSEEDGLGPDKPLPDALVKDLTAHRTLALRLVLGDQPQLAAHVLVHALALKTFYRLPDHTCLEISAASAWVSHAVDGLDDGPTATALQARHDLWAQQVPTHPADLWGYILGLEAEPLGALMAHCVASAVNAVRQPQDRRPSQWEAVERLATSCGLDMTRHWQPTARSYFDRVTKTRIVRAVQDAVSDEAAERLLPLKKQPMAQEAERLLAGTGWLPDLLRTQSGEAFTGEAGPVVEDEDGDSAELPDSVSQAAE